MPEDKTEREREISDGRKSEEKALWDIEDDEIGKLLRKESKE